MVMTSAVEMLVERIVMADSALNWEKLYARRTRKVHRRYNTLHEKD